MRCVKRLLHSVTEFVNVALVSFTYLRDSSEILKGFRLFRASNAKAMSLSYSILRRAIGQSRYAVSRCRRQFSSGYDGDGKTTVSILNRESDAGLMVDSYSQVGFELNSGVVVLGSMALFPRSVLSWNVWTPEDIRKETLSLFFMLAPKLDLLVFGVGDASNVRVCHSRIMEVMREHRVGAEILPTAEAVSTFNFLNAEGRSVAAALIPPTRRLVIFVASDSSVTRLCRTLQLLVVAAVDKAHDLTPFRFIPNRICEQLTAVRICEALLLGSSFWGLRVTNRLPMESGGAVHSVLDCETDIWHKFALAKMGSSSWIACVVVLAALAAGVFAALPSSVNRLDEAFEFSCPPGEAIYHVESEFFRRMNDRMWSFRCRKTPFGKAGSSCDDAQPSYVNQYDGPVDFMCPDTGVLVGVSSKHDNRHEDRMWSFHCCGHINYCRHNCTLKTDLNVQRGAINFTLEDGIFIVGVFSRHNNRYEYDKYYRKISRTVLIQIFHFFQGSSLEHRGLSHRAVRHVNLRHLRPV
ncbi:unnamed protein product [Notodromas monacha]|uniref:NADH dehydrogenase [ubiquinone] 1 alpha subcomplex assembly factor 3 n=1 Tax=Notodromas monacha TaxID=399045 RepID=A0A7R9BEM1_9CRUS|nr:unnamed protein product [Notodromas monacha]CAG0913247.1 unnamed protein product [Notodromas monacha]